MEDTDRKISLVSKTGDKFEISYKAGEFQKSCRYLSFLHCSLKTASSLPLLFHRCCPLHTYQTFSAKLSQLVADATEKFESDCDDDTNDKPTPVDILKVESDCLDKVVEFLNHYEKEPLEEIVTPLADNTFEGVVKQQWYREFVNVDNPMLFDLVTAANFMAIREYVI
jgi:hypothetical protein